MSKGVGKGVSEMSEGESECVNCVRMKNVFYRRFSAAFSVISLSLNPFSFL